MKVPEEIWPRRSDWSGRVVSINKKPGDKVVRGEIVVEVETEKVVLGIESPYDGNIVKVAVAEGDPVKPGSLIALIERS